MVRSSRPKFSIGIYGEWGTGKTTLMKLVEDNLRTYSGNHEFVWNSIGRS